MVVRKVESVALVHFEELLVAQMLYFVQGMECLQKAVQQVELAQLLGLFVVCFEYQLE